MWVCSQCKRTYPDSLRYCPKCNSSKIDHKLDKIKNKHEKFISNYKKINERHGK